MLNKKFKISNIADLWSIIHFGFWAFVSSTIEAIGRPIWWIHLIYGLIGSYAWEIFEIYGEKKWPAKWGYKIEHPINRWIIDPLTNMLGIFFGVLVARIGK